ncbi:MAG TPA: response regulator [Candidatus Angelobacter sp.]|nr:response regulator [Candidatus Angelobacter sp.]
MRILFADDSMTAQNMGKKILTDAGYDVIAVSNGAAAVKKIAEQKPDIIILDIYMPGYSGLEVCDKVRASIETLKTPVLLTVGKMEPYRAEDANRVKADGVIIKPFEASDLLAVIKKLEERIVPKTIAAADETILLERPPDFAEFTPLASENHTEMQDRSENTVQTTVDVPDNMATTAAFSDLLAMEPAHSVDPLPPQNQSSAADVTAFPETPVEPPATIPESAPPPSQEFAVNTPWSAASDRARNEDDEDTSPSHPTPAHAGDHEEHEHSAPAASISFVAAGFEEESSETSASDTQPIPFYQEPEPDNAAAVASPSLATEQVELHPEVDSHVESDTSAVFAAATMPAPEPPPSFIDTGMAADATGFDPFSAKIEAHLQHIETIVAASEARHLEAEVKVPVENGFERSTVVTQVAPAAEDDFEARVAAAMSIYDEPVEDKVEAAPIATDDAQPVTSQEVIPEQAPEPAAFEARYSFEYSPPVSAPEAGPALEAEPPAEVPAVAESTAPMAEPSQHQVETSFSVEPVVDSAEHAAVDYQISSLEEVPNAPHQQIAAQPEQRRVDDEEIISEIEAQLPVASVAAAAAADAEPGTDTQMIAAVVHRVLERLTPQLIEEISRELKSKK